MDTPVRKYQKQKDYQRHKLFRKMKRRRRAVIEQAKDAPMKQLRRKLKIPKFEGGKDESTQKMNRPNIYRYSDGRYVYQAAPDAEEIEVSPINTLLPNPSQWTYQDASGKIYTPHAAQVDTGSIIQDEERNPLVRAANNYFREAAYRAKDGTLALQGKYTMPAIAASALLPWAGEAAYPLLTNPYVDAAAASAFAGHGLNHAINEGINGWGDAAMTALEVAPLGRLAKPMWNAVKEGLQYTAKVADNTARYISPSYDLYRTIGETTPRTTPTLHSFYSSDLTGSGFVENVYTGSPLFEFGQTMRTSPEKAYFMRAPKDVDVLKLGNGEFRHEVVGNEVLPSGEVNGKFVSYGEPWKEFALGENSALYEFPVGPRRGPSLMATDWKGRPQKYSVDEIYDYMQKEKALNEGFRKDVTELGLDKLKGAERVEAYRALKGEKYPELLEDYDTSIHGANQTVIPNEGWNFNKFLKTPFWKYSENPLSGQVQKELMMRWPEAKPLETPAAEWSMGRTAPQITAENAAGITPEQWTAAYKEAVESGNRPENLKLADAITYSPDGTRIPLGSRDNFNISDINYDNSFDNLFSLPGANLKEKEIISYLQNAEPVPRDILRRPLSSLDEDGKVQWSVANGVNDAIKFLRSGGYKARLKNLGYTSDEANYIIDSQIDNIRKADVVTLPKYNKMYSRHGMATPYRRKDGTMGYQIALQPEKSLAYNPRVTAAHEAFHVGSNRHGIKDFTSLPQDIREHNASIRPIVNDDYDAKLVFERLNDEELRTRALEVLARSERANMPVMDYINKWGADPIPGKGPGILRNPNYDHNANDLRTYFTPESLKRYLEGVAGIAAPLAGGTALLGYNSLGQPIDTYKHGKDSGIHINPKNRGKFNALKKRTGKTTEQLTHSKNPLTRKRAIFALNSKKWKH